MAKQTARFNTSQGPIHIVLDQVIAVRSNKAGGDVTVLLPGLEVQVLGDADHALRVLDLEAPPTDEGTD